MHYALCTIHCALCCWFSGKRGPFLPAFSSDQVMLSKGDYGETNEIRFSSCQFWPNAIFSRNAFLQLSAVNYLRFVVSALLCHTSLFSRYWNIDRNVVGQLTTQYPNNDFFLFKQIISHNTNAGSLVNWWRNLENAELITIHLSFQIWFNLKLKKLVLLLMLTFMLKKASTKGWSLAKV